MTTLEYWEETLCQSCEEHGVTLTSEQAKAIARDIQISHENYGMAFYRPSENPLANELREAKAKLEVERSKVVCPECKGSCENVSYGPHHSTVSRCYLCHGDGKIEPSKIPFRYRDT